MSEVATNPKDELQAMTAVAEALEKLDAEATVRVIRWATERFTKGVGIRVADSAEKKAASSFVAVAQSTPQYAHMADLYAAASPETDADRALVAGYWFQYIEEQPDFAAQTINSSLNDMGHRVANITNAFAALMGRKPQLVVQLKKSGTSKQARKTYKLTTAGKGAVEGMIAGIETE